MEKNVKNSHQSDASKSNSKFNSICWENFVCKKNLFFFSSLLRSFDCHFVLVSRHIRGCELFSFFPFSSACNFFLLFFLRVSLCVSVCLLAFLFIRYALESSSLFCSTDTIAANQINIILMKMFFFSSIFYLFYSFSALFVSDWRERVKIAAKQNKTKNRCFWWHCACDRDTPIPRQYRCDLVHKLCKTETCACFFLIFQFRFHSFFSYFYCKDDCPYRGKKLVCFFLWIKKTKTKERKLCGTCLWDSVRVSSSDALE